MCSTSVFFCIITMTYYNYKKLFSFRKSVFFFQNELGEWARGDAQDLSR